MVNILHESEKCMDCGIPFCHAWGCPLGNIIPEINENIISGNYYEAWLLLEEYNNFPEITGLLCPGMCEASCTRSINEYPVPFKSIEYALAEEAFLKGWVKPCPPPKDIGMNAAVIGSGPSGLAAAQQLRKAGFSVTVYEKDRKPGGILRYGIPSFKLDKKILDRRIKLMVQEGIVFQNCVNAGVDLSPDYLKRFNDVVVLCLGAGTPRNIKASGSGYENIIFAMDYLSSHEKALSGEEITVKNKNAKGKKVLIIGGGDTGSDCAGTAERQGAEKIYQFELLSMPPEWDGAVNPSWPDYPVFLKKPGADEQLCERQWGVEVYRFSGRDIYAEKAACRKVEWYYDRDAGRNSYRPVLNSDFEIDVDMVIISAGFLHVEQSPFLAKLGVSFDHSGSIKCIEGFRTASEKIFAAGDCFTGASLVAKAVKSGRDAAGNIIDLMLR